jgi:hypothetical protein
MLMACSRIGVVGKQPDKEDVKALTLVRKEGSFVKGK